MSQTPTSPASPATVTPPNHTTLWVNYILLGLFCFCLTIHMWLAWLGPVAWVVGIIARKRLYEQGDETGALHAAWQCNTIWIAALLCMVGIVAFVGVLWWMGQDPTIESQINNLTNGDLPPVEMLQGLWAVPGIKAIVALMCAFAVLFLVWPLKRVIQGVLALRAATPPAHSTLLGIVATMAALAVQIGIILLIS